LKLLKVLFELLNYVPAVVDDVVMLLLLYLSL